jgi:radical SAM superfamily enzyme YgiQ (UPF0313 family)
MLALPGESPEDARATVDFAIRLDLDYALFNVTFPDPGTELYDIAKANGKLTPYRGMHRATFVPEGYKDEKEVEEIVHRAYTRFYFRPRYIFKRVRSIRKVSDIVRYLEGLLFLKGIV